jgi:arsenite methyltransferase
MSDRNLTELIREKYGRAARNASRDKAAACGCCAPGPGGEMPDNPVTSKLYDTAEAETLPAEALQASLGCGNPTALAELEPGETVLDLGSGGGIDVLLSARRVGPGGKAYGLDMTDEMLDLARANQERAGVTNVEFRKGEIEDIPLPDASVDVIISNCVINLSTDKDRVFAEAFRVLRPGGRLAISDIVVRGEVPDAVRRSMELWIGCIAGALEEADYREGLARAGFEWIEIEPTRVYRSADAGDFLERAGENVAELAAQVDGKFRSAFIRARKPR